MSVLDIGGNIGDTAIKFCLLGASKVVVFEPLPSLLPLLKKNIADNLIQDRVAIFNYGLADTSCGMSILVRPNATAGTSTHLHGVNTLRERYDHDVERVQIKDFRSFVPEEGLGCFDVVKLDCEHCEYALFKDDTFLRITRPKHIFLEYHSGYAGIYDLLEENGYSIDVFEKNDRVGVLKAVRLLAGQEGL